VTGIRTRWKGPADQPPAIYICNHASSLDFFVVMTHIPRNTCSVGKPELLYIPFLGTFYALGGHRLIDRRNPERAHASMSKAAAFVLANSMNVWLAPEGTRSKDGTLGEFKKGFVHTAIATGLPVVPVLLHGFAKRWPLAFPSAMLSTTESAARQPCSLREALPLGTATVGNHRETSRANR
jgi:1-acyl-sn-glycerol-3-phosphate acyltransferase